MMTSNDSTAPYGPDEWHKYTQLLDHMDRELFIVVYMYIMEIADVYTVLSNESQTQNPDRGHAIAASGMLFWSLFSALI